MSKIHKEERSWHLYIQDMIDFAEKILPYTNELDQETFITETLVYDATLRNLELIGEAATHVPNEIREVHLEIEWRDIIGTRNQLAHSYLGIDDDVIWDIIQIDLPNLLPKLHNLLNTTKEDSV